MPASILLALVLGTGADAPRVFTNDDLDRIAPYSVQTGGSSTSSAASLPPPPAPPDRSAAAGKSSREPYWRAEARRVRQRIQLLEDRAVALRQQVEERRQKPGVLPYSDPQIRRWQGSAEAQLTRAREMEADLLDRARREGALPGWVR